ncbi:hypothetical protein [Clostridium sp. C8-1-8]|uniref:hypothetical protein n=1 Tax=Clostridium sp. C8-1-8 TaxID=2698831 RepID=UPI00136BB25C|nr:hypothetical protein [Clostridium sp. C8-1-8]
MYYIKVVFNAEACDKLAYCFKINMLSGELEITYNNFQGGYTTKGIKLSTKQLTHLEQLLRIDNFNRFIENQNMNNNISSLDPYDWSLQCISNDGNPMLEMPNIDGAYVIPPNSVINLIDYISKIGIEPDVLKGMRLF